MCNVMTVSYTNIEWTHHQDKQKLRRDSKIAIREQTGAW